jgi:hypothetical protein
MYVKNRQQNTGLCGHATFNVTHFFLPYKVQKAFFKEKNYAILTTNKLMKTSHLHPCELFQFEQETPSFSCQIFKYFS